MAETMRFHSGTVYSLRLGVKLYLQERRDMAYYSIGGSVLEIISGMGPCFEIKVYGGRKVTGVLPGLQNLCGAAEPSRVGSIPTCPRQSRRSIQTYKRKIYKKKE